MRLSKLHINGFKSFPDRAELGFDHGVTAIVGPNGCGKSNVVDAITWVLGEQSAKSLRGERMEDVIFNGSDARKPTAAAEVRLRLSDVAQAAMMAAAHAPVLDALVDEGPLVTRNVEIGRRLYRSGESEYLIDGEVCRLRDVHDLLMDSGLGVKAYAVIEQGKIGQILSSRPVERRMLIEEAAGVTKYKSRRRAAELKLEAAQQNLTRIDDIIFEVEKQRAALRRQAARARRYKRLREELRRWEQVQFARRHERLAREIEEADAALAGARAREAAAAAHVAELDAALEAVRLELTQGEAASTDVREQAHSRELLIGRRQQQVTFDKQQIEELARQGAAYAQEVADLEERREPARRAIETQRAAADTARGALEVSGATVTTREHAYSLAAGAVHEAEQTADHARAAVLSAEGTLSALRQARDHADSARARVAADREKLAFEARELEHQVGRTSTDEAAATQARADAGIVLAHVRQALTAAEHDLVARRSARERLADTLREREREHAGASARLTSLEQLEASRASFGDAARFLLAAGAEAPPRHGALADQLDVERTFERAVDALLGDLLQHVIVERAEDADRALALVAEAQAGRCGLIVLDGATGAPPVSEVAAPAGVRTLRSVVRPVGPHAAVLVGLLGDAWIVDSSAAARDCARQAPVPVATLTGEVWRGAHRVEGGTRAERRGILEARGELALLRDQVALGATELARLTAEAAAADHEMRGAEQAVARETALVHDHEKAMVSLEADQTRLAADRARLDQRRTVVTTELRQAAEAEDDAARRRDDAVAAIARHDAEREGAEARMAEVVATLQMAREAAEAAMRAVSEARAEQAALTERLSALEVEVGRLEAVARELEERIANGQRELAGTIGRREALTVSIHDTERLLDDDVRELERLRTEVRRLDERVTELRGLFTAREHDIRAARHALDQVRTEVGRLDVARATAAADLSHLATACLETIGLDIDAVVVAVARMEDAGELVAPARRLAAVAARDAAEEAAEAAEDAGSEVSLDATTADEGAADPGASTEEAPLSPEQIILELKQKIDRLGPVNMMAIEQFDDLETRHTFLTTQRKDLLDSIAQTGEAIRQIDKTTRERFDEAFTTINREFQGTFATLFGGGRAGLVLIDQDNDTESGIDMIAQPPGKRLQNVQLLSGGEKALTAMALMFAIFKYRPSPFCLLDEIDAPLDDANIGRFVEMLQGMQSHTQFILITHNRKTMEIANRLYGVTMEEPGVSKLISLELQ